MHIVHTMLISQHRDGSGLKVGGAREKQLLQLHRRPFFGRSASPWFSEGRAFVGDDIALRFRHDVHPSFGRAMACIQSLQSRNGQKVTVQQKQSAAKCLCGRKPLLDHLYHMRRGFFLVDPLPSQDRLDPILQVHEQGQAEPLLRSTG